MQRFRVPFLGFFYDRPTQYEDRKARFGRHRFVEETVGTKVLDSPPDSDLVQPSTAAAANHKLPELISRRPSLRSTVVRTVTLVAAATAAAFFVLALVSTTTGGLCFEVVLWANPLIGMRILTERIGRPDGPCFAHAIEIGRLRMEASFGSWSHSDGAIDYANIAKGGKLIPALTSPLYSHPIRFDLTRVDKAFWKSFGPRPVIHPPEMALSGGNLPGQCWAFAGHTGQMGIRLPEVIRVISFTVEHTGNNSFIDSAPRNIILWGLIPKDTNGVSLSSESLTRTYHATSHTPQFGALHTGIPLASVTFDAVEGQPRQTFPVRCKERHRTFDSLLAQFEGNWGHPDFTCLYRLEINGEGISKGD